jgi:predicted enzyme related to lactoylglutathione lyase
VDDQVGVVQYVTVDCADPGKLAGFWSGVLGVPVEGTSGAYVWLEPQRAGAARLAFQPVPEPKAGKARLHLDLGVADLAAARRRCEDLGATVGAEIEENGSHWQVMADPEGNEFCLMLCCP